MSGSNQSFRKGVRVFAEGLGMLLIVVLAYREFLIYKIPSEERTIAYRLGNEPIPIPKRPGTKSVRIIGPKLNEIKFQLDFTKNPSPLDWRMLEASDARADVKVEGIIDEDGFFTITRVLDKGHPQAGRYIRRVMETWKFRPYKLGPIAYYFNVPTVDERKKVIVDLGDLRKNLKHTHLRDYLVDGLVFYIEGIKLKNVTFIK